MCKSTRYQSTTMGSKKMSVQYTMRASVIIFIICFIIETRQTQSSRAIRKWKTTANREAALDKAKIELQVVVDKLQQEIKDLEEEQYNETESVSQKRKITNTIASTLLDHALKKWEDLRLNAKNEYEPVFSRVSERIKNARQEKDAAFQAANDKFEKVYREIENNREKAENEHKEELEKGRTFYENALESAEETKNEAEEEYEDVVNRSTMILPTKWTKIIAKRNAEMKTYEEILEKAEKEWQEVLDKAGVGKQYEDAINQAVNELNEAREKAEALFSKTEEECKEELRKAEEVANEARKQVDDGVEKAWQEYREITDKARQERKKLKNLIDNRWEMKLALPKLELWRAHVKYREAADEANRKYDRA
ncbi:hypothetical protein V9T40_014776 [Parthenolecanium corni]|uniref:Uncharacterized protein n=1 Tax=Parthenolecanium corni TaxID=536013 RepID=A0AAN9T6D0_9HEMI